MTDFHPQLISLAHLSRDANELLRAAVCDGCRSCVAQISDLSRETISDLSEFERRYSVDADRSPTVLQAAQSLAACVLRAFSAAMLLPSDHPSLPPLGDIVSANARLAEYALEILTSEQPISFYPLHLTANKGRGAHALLINNYCSTPTGSRLVPLALTLEALRNTLEKTCGILIGI